MGLLKWLFLVLEPDDRDDDDWDIEEEISNLEEEEDY